MKEYDFCSEAEFFERLGRYVSIETPSGDKDQMELLNALLEEDLIKAGAVVERHIAPKGDILRAQVGKGTHRVLLLGHKDTVFLLGTLQQNPYREELYEGETVLRGLGVLDMKSGVCMILELLRHFAKQPIPDWQITALLNCDEEIGSRESEALIRQLSRESDFCICMEPSKAEYCTVARKGLAPYRITVHGIAAHSGVNYQKGASAIEGLCRVIAKVYDLRDDSRDLSVNIGSIEAPGKNNIVSAYACAKGEIRCYDRELMKQTLQEIEKICKECSVPGVQVEFEYTAGRPPMVKSKESKWLYETAAECAKKHGLMLRGRAHGGGSDGSFAADEGVPVIDGMGAEGENSHTADEYVKKSTLYARMKLCADVIVSAVNSGSF